MCGLTKDSVFHDTDILRKTHIKGSTFLGAGTFQFATSRFTRTFSVGMQHYYYCCYCYRYCCLAATTKFTTTTTTTTTTATNATTATTITATTITATTITAATTTTTQQGHGTIPTTKTCAHFTQYFTDVCSK